MLLIFYNIQHHSFYQVYKNSTNLKLGDLNGFGHMLVQILYIYDNKFYSILDCYDIHNVYINKSIKKRFIKRIVRFLNKKYLS